MFYILLLFIVNLLLLYCKVSCFTYCYFSLLTYCYFIVRSHVLHSYCYFSLFTYCYFIVRLHGLHTLAFSWRRLYIYSLLALTFLCFPYCKVVWFTYCSFFLEAALYMAASTLFGRRFRRYLWAYCKALAPNPYWQAKFHCRSLSSLNTEHTSTGML